MNLLQAMNYIYLNSWFNLQEFHCPHCQAVKISMLLWERLLALRGIIRQPMIITSGYRCEIYNREVGGVDNSLHTHGLAVDVLLHGHSGDDLAAAAEVAGFNEIIEHPKKGYIHLGVDPKHLPGVQS